jgi:membrane protease YdiL (CAAX protease family)
LVDHETHSHSFPWKYFVIAFVFSWIVWLPGVLAARGLFDLPVPELALAGIGAFGPFVSAFYLTRRTQGKEGVKTLIKRALNFRIHMKWLAAIVVIHLAVTAAARYLYIWRGGEVPDSPVLGSPVAILVLFIVLFFVGGSVNEEFGWRGYALDRIQLQHNALLSSLILGLLWGFWHLPLFFFRTLSQSFMSFWIFLGWTCALAVLMTWLHNNNRGNIMVALLFHTMGNLSPSIFPFFTMEKGADQTPMLFATVLYSLVALLVVMFAGPKKLSRKPDAEMPFRILDLS